MPDDNGLDTSFPGLRPGSPATHTRPYTQHTWSGGKERLIVVQGLLDGVLREEYERELSKLDLSDPADLTARRKLERLKETFTLRVKVTGKGDRWTQRGELSQIFGTVDLDDVEAVSMSSGDSYLSTTSIEVYFKAETKIMRDAVTCTVQATNATWVTGVADQLARTLSKDRPTWSFLRTFWTPAIATLLVVIGLITTATNFVDFTHTQALILSLLYSAGGTYFLLFGTIKLFEWLLPAFEIIPAGGRSLGGKRLAAIGVVALFVLTNLILPIALNFILD